jgi:hypothetical protein
MKDLSFGVSLTQPQRIVIAELFPQLIDRLKLDVNRQVKIEFTVSLMKAIWWCAGEAVPTTSGAKRNSLRCIIAALRQAIQDAHGIAAIAPSKRLYQFKITLLDIAPVIWRRIQIKNGSVDKLHECIQTAMGWTNSHLHRFEIQGIACGDPELICDDPDSFVGTNSLETMVSDIVPQSGARFQFSYEYDFGDCWRHDVLFEGCLPTDHGVRYPLCLEGERACPPEDVGGVDGYEEFLEVIADPSHPEHEEWMTWAGGDFDPTRFDAKAATKEMQRGLPDWRQLERQREPLACR